MSPVQIETILHFYYSPEPVISLPSRSQSESINHLAANGLLEARGPSLAGWKITSRGEAYVAALEAVPLPVRHEFWVVESQRTERAA